jgi:hypothetical protein
MPPAMPPTSTCAVATATSAIPIAASAVSASAVAIAASTVAIDACAVDPTRAATAACNNAAASGALHVQRPVRWQSHLRL